MRSLEYSAVVTGLLYIGIIIALKTIVSLPFSLYSTFVIEEKFGFNRTTLKTYIIDFIKSTIISSQLPVSKWYDVIGEGTIADAILDRLVNGAHRIDLKGESLRKKK